MLLSDVETEIWDADVISNRKKKSHGKIWKRVVIFQVLFHIEVLVVVVRLEGSARTLEHEKKMSTSENPLHDTSTSIYSL